MQEYITATKTFLHKANVHMQIPDHFHVYTTSYLFSMHLISWKMGLLNMISQKTKTTDLSQSCWVNVTYSVVCNRSLGSNYLCVDIIKHLKFPISYQIYQSTFVYINLFGGNNLL